ncbi:uncharacterized protein LOC125090446 [Lutra lutra]|uniref:uncharacterized protein LOC125090446 n=1 Tax=Lutra lutra TaxID=9657 RepID=UPI001FCFC98C|nr:uncharacterized protein LOC125090446 [Lutra lutra]
MAGKDGIWLVSGQGRGPQKARPWGHHVTRWSNRGSADPAAVHLTRSGHAAELESAGLEASVTNRNLSDARGRVQNGRCPCHADHGQRWTSARRRPSARRQGGLREGRPRPRRPLAAGRRPSASPAPVGGRIRKPGRGSGPRARGQGHPAGHGEAPREQRPAPGAEAAAAAGELKAAGWSLPPCPGLTATHILHRPGNSLCSPPPLINLEARGLPPSQSLFHACLLPEDPPDRWVCHSPFHRWGSRMPGICGSKQPDYGKGKDGLSSLTVRVGVDLRTPDPQPATPLCHLRGFPWLFRKLFSLIISIHPLKIRLEQLLE